MNDGKITNPLFLGEFKDRCPTCGALLRLGGLGESSTWRPCPVCPPEEQGDVA